MIREQIQSRQISPNEARAMDNRPPYTDDQIKEFSALGLNPRGTTPATALAPVPVDPSKVDAEYAPGEASGNTAAESPTGGNQPPAANPPADKPADKPAANPPKAK
jgi:hypothetical protein